MNHEMDEMINQIDLMAMPPVDEPVRQYYFMKKCRQYVNMKSQDVGRPLYAAVTTYGCQMNLE